MAAPARAPAGEHPNEAEQITLLSQFLKFNIPVNALIAASMFAIWYFTRFWSILIIASSVAAYIGVLWFARRRLRQGQITLAVFCIALGAIALDLSGEFLSAGSVLPTLALLTLWPVMLALPHLRKRPMVILMGVSTAAAAALSGLSFAGDQIGLMHAVPWWVPLAVNAFCMPLFVGFLCLAVWHYSSHLETTVTQLRTANAQLHESERILEQRVAERTQQLAEQNAKLMRLDDMKTQFVSNASHELRSPLTSIRAFSELLADDPGLSDTQLEFARTINLESERLSRLTNDLLDLSRIESGVVAWQPKPVDLRREIGKLVEAQWIVARQKGLALEEDLPDELPAVLADADALRQVLLNLTNNALKFTEEGRITVAAHAAPERVHVAISDTGPGISAEDQARVFERFYQAGNILTEKPQGAGLGLAICREILAQHGSELHVESALGQGSCFSFDLPLA
jgi:signal transduction histidine kinase